MNRREIQLLIETDSKRDRKLQGWKKIELPEPKFDLNRKIDQIMQITCPFCLMAGIETTIGECNCPIVGIATAGAILKLHELRKKWGSVPIAVADNQNS